MQLFYKLLSSLTILFATVLLILTLMATVGISKYVAFFGIFLAAYLAYLCWSRPRARTMTTVVSLVGIILMGSFLYAIIPTESVDTDPANYLSADYDFTTHAREVMPQSLEHEMATKVEYRHMRYGLAEEYIRLDYCFAGEDFASQVEAFAQRYPLTGETLRITVDGHERTVHQIETNQDAAFYFAYSPDAETHKISLLYAFDPLFAKVMASEVLTDWHFESDLPS